MVRRSPSAFGFTNSRWRLAQLLESCDWLRLGSLPGLSQLLHRLGIRYKRGRDYVHSPDAHYWDKLDLLERRRLRAYYAPERYVFLYLDQFTYYRQPSLARAFEAAGHQQPLARRSWAKNNAFRILAALNALTGQVTYRQRRHTDVPCLAAFWSDVRQAYPGAEEIYVVVDNWPVLFHPDVLAPLQEQHLPWPPYVPPHWPTQPSGEVPAERLPIQLLCLPTYASWLNPIEKLWRWLNQEVLHLHRLSDDWPALRQAIADVLDGFAVGSESLLRYVGLWPAPT